MKIRGCRNSFKGKIVFLLFGELSRAGAVGLSGQFGLKELQPCNSFWYCLGYGSHKLSRYYNFFYKTCGCVLVTLGEKEMKR